MGSLADQIYRKWVEDNRAYVAKISDGKLGYVHMRDMSDAGADAALSGSRRGKSRAQGVVIDIRNNNGGFVNAYALDVLSRRPYLTMTDRDGPPSPARTVLGQRSLELPTILVVNQHSLSDAEDFTEGYRTLKLGKVVGEPTAGWIIYTGGDGTGGRIDHADAVDPGAGSRRQGHGTPSAAGGYYGFAADRGDVYRKRFAVGCGGEGASGRDWGRGFTPVNAGATGKFAARVRDAGSC